MVRGKHSSTGPPEAVMTDLGLAWPPLHKWPMAGQELQPLVSIGPLTTSPKRLPIPESSPAGVSWALEA